MIYIAGPMTGIPEFNFPAFHAAAATLRAYGYEVVSPAEIPAEADKPWDYYMRKDLAEMLKCDTIYLLRGWDKSKGACLEKHIAEALGMMVIFE
jgi:nucleoside 2-deoxyribosyltransferase